MPTCAILFLPSSGYFLFYLIRNRSGLQFVHRCHRLGLELWLILHHWWGRAQITGCNKRSQTVAHQRLPGSTALAHDVALRKLPADGWLIAQGVDTGCSICILVSTDEHWLICKVYPFNKSVVESSSNRPTCRQKWFMTLITPYLACRHGAIWVLWVTVRFSHPKFNFGLPGEDWVEMSDTVRAWVCDTLRRAAWRRVRATRGERWKGGLNVRGWNAHSHPEPSESFQKYDALPTPPASFLSIWASPLSVQ